MKSLKQAATQCKEKYQVDYINPIVLQKYYEDPLNDKNVSEYMACVMNKMNLLKNGQIDKNYFMGLSNKEAKVINNRIVAVCSEKKGRNDAETVAKFIKCTHWLNIELMREIKNVLIYFEML